MTRPPLLEALQTRRLVGDGAMGTQLMLAGLESGACGEAWNLTHPERVLAIQRRYAEAGIWARTPDVSRQGFARLGECLLSGGFISRMPIYEDCVDQSLS